MVCTGISCDYAVILREDAVDAEINELQEDFTIRHFWRQTGQWWRDVSMAVNDIAEAVSLNAFIFQEERDGGAYHYWSGYL